MLGHRNIIRYCNRPFDSVEEMDDTIIKNFFNYVRENKVNTVYYLGDLAFGKKMAQQFFEMLSGASIQFHFIRGSHDSHIQDSLLKKYCASVSNLKNITINKQPVTLCHHPMLSWHRSHYGAIMIHGHHHSNIIVNKFSYIGKLVNVSVDVCDFKPISFEDIINEVKYIPNWNTVDRIRK